MYRHFSLKTANEARKLLVKCAERKDGRDFIKTYFICGIKCDESNPDAPSVTEYCLVRDEHFDVAKSKFSKVTASHLYSLQMSKIQDLTCLYTADLSEDKDEIINASKASLVKNRKVQTSQSIQSPKVEDAVIPQVPPSTSDGNNPKAATSKLKTRVPDAKQKPVAVKEVKGSLKNMFMAQAAKKSTADKSSVINNDVKVKKELHSVENLRSDKQISVKCPANEDDDKKENEKGNGKDDKCVKKQEILTVSSDKIKSNGHKNKKLTSKKDSAPSKKRRRIIAVSDSSSNESDDSNNSCDIMETDDIIEEPPKPKEIVCRSPSPNGVRKKRKLVEETVVDDNGYLVTKKKWEHVSDSDEPECEKVEVKPVILTDNKTKKKSPASNKEVGNNKNKQAVLTSFFLRK